MTSIPPLVDSHIHLYEFDDIELESLCKDDYVMLAVSDDILSSFKTVEIARKCKKVIPAIGVHPWTIKGEVKIDPLIDLINKNPVRFLGEVGLDKRFVPETFEFQLRVFKEFIELAETYKLGISLHAPDAWRDALEVLKKSSVRVVIFHWYTGPLDLIKEVIDEGFYIGINVAAKFQKKHAEVIKVVPIERLVTESDGPYRYRGVTLKPSLLPELVSFIASTKGLSEHDVRIAIWSNFSKILKDAGLLL